MVRARKPIARVGTDAALLDAALQCSGEPLLIVDGFDRICFANEAAATLFGVRLDELLADDLQRHLFQGDRTDALLGGALERARGGPCTLVLLLGDGRAVRAKLTPLGSRISEQAHVCITLGLAPQEHAAAALESLGRLSAGLAHDINNQLAAALNYVFVLRRRVGDSAELAQHLEGLQAAAWRAAMLTSGLRLLGRPRKRGREALALNATIAAMAPLLRHLAQNVRLELDLAPGLPELVVPLPQLEQVILLVSLYALGRVPTGSTLALRTSQPVPEDPSRIRFCCELPTATRTRPARSPETAETNAALRRALKLCGGRLGHDRKRVWVDFDRGD
ncbi:MAG: PAS domain-containing protein [Polyangiales bacterium]